MNRTIEQQVPLVALRETATGKILNVAFTTDGLRFTADVLGYYIPIFNNPDVVVENYEYKLFDHLNNGDEKRSLINWERTFARKAMILRNINNPDRITEITERQERKRERAQRALR